MKKWQWVKHALHSLVKHPPPQTEPAVNVNVHQSVLLVKTRHVFLPALNTRAHKRCSHDSVWLPASSMQRPHALATQLPSASPRAMQLHQGCVSASWWRKAAGASSQFSLTPLFQWANRTKINSRGIPCLLFRFSPYNLARNHSNPQETPLRKAEYVTSIRVGKQAIWREVGTGKWELSAQLFQSTCTSLQTSKHPPKKPPNCVPEMTSLIKSTACRLQIKPELKCTHMYLPKGTSIKQKFCFLKEIFTCSTLNLHEKQTCLDKRRASRDAMQVSGVTTNKQLHRHRGIRNLLQQAGLQSNPSVTTAASIRSGCSMPPSVRLLTRVVLSRNKTPEHWKPKGATGATRRFGFAVLSLSSFVLPLSSDNRPTKRMAKTQGCKQHHRQLFSRHISTPASNSIHPDMSWRATKTLCSELGNAEEHRLVPWHAMQGMLEVFCLAYEPLFHSVLSITSTLSLG